MLLLGTARKPDGRKWNRLRIGLLLGVFVAFGAGTVDAGKKKDAGKQSHKLKAREVTDEQLQDLIQQYQDDVRLELEELDAKILFQMERDYERHLATGEEFVRDILILSGGGAKGAFGAGFLQGWGTIESGPMARPEFDVSRVR